MMRKNYTDETNNDDVNPEQNNEETLNASESILE